MRERALSKDEKIAHYEDMLGITEDNTRYAGLRDAYGLSPGATWLLSRLVAAKGRWLPKGTLLDAIPGMDDADDRDLSAVKVRVHEIRGRFGKEHVENDRLLGYRLSKAMRDKLDPQVVISIVHEPLRLDEAMVRRLLNDPDTLPLDAMRIHGRWRAQGG